MTRKEALDIIVFEVAAHGKVTSKALRLYSEHRISYTAFAEITSRGIRKYNISKERNKEQWDKEIARSMQIQDEYE